MSVYCKRNFFQSGETKAKWIKGKYYKVGELTEWELELDFYLVIESEFSIGANHHYSPINKKEFHKYFTQVDDLRDNKIDEILNRQRNS